jgi:hypothetical protein
MPDKGLADSRSRVSSASKGQDIVRSLAFFAAVAQRPWPCSQPEQANSRGRRRPRRTAILLGFWWCAKTAAGEAAALGGRACSGVAH